MKDNIQLYIGGMPVDLTDNVDILFNFSTDDLTNPTIVRNSYSKSVTLEDTPNNSRIFGHFWCLDRAQAFEGQAGISYNPSKRVPFTLYANGEIYQSGYAKLTNVRKSGKNNQYQCLLFGGLGSFLFNLSYLDDNNTDNNKRKLSDLHFIPGSVSEKEFDFTIKQETVIDAWSNVNTADESNMWHYINFADCYDGVPSDFDADKVLMYFGTSAATATTDTTPVLPNRRPGGGSDGRLIYIESSTTESDYTSYDGYAVATMSGDRTAQQMREYRSYLLRPVLRVKDTILACCDPENNGGYEVELDGTFFTDSNPHWEKAYMTLPLLSSMDFNGVEGDEQTGVTASLGNTVTGGTKTGDTYEEKTEIVLGTISANTYFNFEVDVNISALMNSLPSGYDTTSPIFPCAYAQSTSTYYPGAIEVQLVAYSLDGKVITGSDLMNCTSSYGQRRTGSREGTGYGQSYFPTPNDFNFQPAFNSQYVTKSVEFDYASGSTWNMNQTLHLSLKKVPKTATVKLVVNKINLASLRYHPTNKAMLMFQRYSENSVTKYRQGAVLNHFEYTLSNVEVSLISGEGIRTGARFTKADLLNTDYTPADFLLSYCKLFGMYIEKDKYEDKIYIRTRDTFYRKENVHDLSKLIDYSKDINITPTVFDAKWYNWAQETKDGYFAKDYEDTYGVPFEIQRTNTGYNFDASEKDLYKGNIFKGAVECLEKSDMFGYITDHKYSEPWMYDGFTYDLYSTEDLSDTLEMEVKPLTKKGNITSYSDNSQYDLFTKLQFHGDDNNATDGSNVLCFFAGSVPTKTLNTGEDIEYYVTDDNAYMSVLNDNTACWLCTASELDSTQTRIATKITSIPHFTRYLQVGGNIMHSWGFGTPHQLYIPDYTIDYPATLYSKYWRSYIKDMYDIDSKKLSCFVHLDERPTEEWLRDFYWFDNSIWRINRIIEANVKNKNTTNIEFIKVQDRYAYTNDVVTDIPNISLSASTYTVTNTGGTVTIYVTVNDGGRWYVSDTTYMMYSASTSSGLGNGSFEITIPFNSGTTSIVHSITVEDAYDQWARLEINQADLVFSVKEFANYSHGDVPQTGGTALFELRSSYPWSVTLDRTYAEISPSSGPGSSSAQTLELTFGLNTSYAPRNVKMVFENSEGNQITLYKWQEGIPVFSIERTDGSGDIAQAGTTAGLRVNSPDYSWTASTEDSFVTLIDPSGTSTSSMGVAFDENTGASRTATILVTNSNGNQVTYTLTQAGNAVPVNPISPQYLEFEASGGTATITNTIPGQWEIVARPGWCICMPISGNTGSAINVWVSDYNLGETARTDSIVVWDRTNGQTYVVTVRQKAATDTLLEVQPTSINFDATGGTATFTIRTNTNWDIQ